MASVSHVAGFDLDQPVESVFPLFTPEGEKLWAPGWDYENVMGATALHEDYVFLTRTHDHAAAVAVWIVKKYEPDDYTVHYYKIEPQSKVGMVTRPLPPAGAGPDPGRGGVCLHRAFRGGQRLHRRVFGTGVPGVHRRVAAADRGLFQEAGRLKDAAPGSRLPGHCHPRCLVLLFFRVFFCAGTDAGDGFAHDRYLFAGGDRCNRSGTPSFSRFSSPPDSAIGFYCGGRAGTGMGPAGRDQLVT